MYKYETHLHTSPVSACARASVRDTVQFYKDMGYDGIFITNHFLPMIGEDKSYEERIEYFCSDYEEAVKIGKELGIKVFFGLETGYGGADFLVYGLDKEWFLQHPQIPQMRKSEELALYMENGALVVHAHPFRDDSYIDHIRLFPKRVHGVEVINANRTEFINEMARQYAENYRLLPFAGSDNHVAHHQKKLAGMQSAEPIMDEQDFVTRVKNGELEIFFTERE
ncbi:MAG: histidinol phosphatase [Oscillospiraceae bacterium]|nr:histidinol phosphatase [Oscillospiraceae bacterium]